MFWQSLLFLRYSQVILQGYAKGLYIRLRVTECTWLAGVSWFGVDIYDLQGPLLP